MKHRLISFIASLIFCGGVLSFGCSGGGDGGGGGPEPGENPLPAKIVWYQEAPEEATPPTDQQADEKDKAFLSKAITGPYSGEEVRKEKAMGFFVSNLDGTGIARLTPTKNSALALAEAIAPNGDFFYFTQAGIWISNFKNPAPKLLISARKLFTNFDEAGEMLLAWNDSMLSVLKAHYSKSYIFIDTIPTGGDGGEYVAVLLLPVKYTKKDSDSEEGATLPLRYDSKTGTLSHIIPFMSSLKNNKSEYFSYYLPLEGDDMKNKTLSLGDFSWDPYAKKLTYEIRVSSSPDGKTQINDATIAYDPVTAKHTVIYKVTTISGEPSLNDISPLGADFIRDTPKIQLKEGDCTFTYTPKVVGGTDVAAIEAGKKTASCLSELIKGKSITIRKALDFDITASIGKKEDLVNAVISAPGTDGQTAASIEFGLIKQFNPLVKKTWDTSSVYFYETNDIICKDYNGQTKCMPKKFNDCNNKDKCYASYNLYNYYHRGSNLVFIGETKKGDDIFSAIYAVDLAKGTVAVVDKGDETTYLSGLSSAPASGGGVFVYFKRGKNTNFEAFNIYDPALGKTLTLTNPMPSSMYANIPSFACSDGVRSIGCGGISYDKKYAFIGMSDELGRYQTYARDISSFYAVPETTKAKGPAGAAKSAGAESSEPAVPISPPQSGNLLGEGWIKISPDVEHKEIKYYLQAFDGYKAVWLGNKEGFNYLYWNEPFKDVTPRRIDPQGYNSEQILMSLATGFGLSGATALAPPADMDSAYKCGTAADSGQAWCEKSFEVCVGGACRDMFSCSADVPDGYCPNNGVCVNSACQVGCVPNCTGKVCGSNGCGGSCGTCPTGKTCSDLGDQCVSTACVPNCQGKQCGADGCGGSCGTCQSGQTCNAAGQCTAIDYSATNLSMTAQKTGDTTITSCPKFFQCASYKYTFTPTWACSNNQASCQFTYQLFAGDFSSTTPVSNQEVITCNSCAPTISDVTVTFMAPPSVYSNFGTKQYTIRAGNKINAQYTITLTKPQ